MTNLAVLDKEYNKGKGLVKSGGNQLAGNTLFVTSHKPSNGYLGTLKPWWDINYQGLLFFFDQDSQPGFELTVIIPWFDLVSQGILFTIE